MSSGRTAAEGHQVVELADRPRATRYEMSAPLVYRSVGGESWLSGRTVNVSRSGVLFEAESVVLPADTRIEFILMLPSLGLPGSARVHCHGQVVRHGEAPKDGASVIAATIDAYEFLGTAPEACQGSVGQ